MQSCHFFNFLKNCPYDLYEILHSHCTPKGDLACAKASKSYDWDVRNVAKIAQKWPETAVVREGGGLDSIMNPKILR